jgi:multiple antibiotic resistance protein
VTDAVAFGLFCFVSLFAMVEPLGVMPVYVAMTAPLPPREQRAVARQAVLIAALTLLLFAVAGPVIFRFFGISVNSLKVVGGVIFFVMGYEMLHARLTTTAFEESKSPRDYGRDVALTPLGIPMICGPGAIANVIVLWNEANGQPAKITALLLALGLVMLLTLLILLGARRVARHIGENGNKVLLRLMGLITMVIAVEFFFGGLKPIVRDMLAER